MRTWICTALALAALPSAPARADELRFRNGDRLSGKVVSMAAGKLVFASAIAGKLTVAMADLETFSTDGPVVVELDDGTRLSQPIERAAPGSFRIGGEGALTAQDFVLARATRINPEPDVWHGAIAAGAQFQRGNSLSDSAHLDLSGRRRGERDRIGYTAGYLGARQTEKDKTVAPGVTQDVTTTTQRRLFGGLQYDWFFTRRFYGYTRLHAEKDGVALLDLRLLASPGVGWQVWELPERSLSLETGLAWVSENFSDDTEDEDFLALRGAWNWEQALIGRLRLFHTGEWFPGLESGTGHLVKTATGLRTGLTDRFFLEGKALFDWDSQPAEDAERRDVIYLLSLGWSY